MPIPKTQDVGKTIKFLKKEKPNMPQKQKVAIALSTARKAGAKIPQRPVMEIPRKPITKIPRIPVAEIPQKRPTAEISRRPRRRIMTDTGFMLRK